MLVSPIETTGRSENCTVIADRHKQPMAIDHTVKGGCILGVSTDPGRSVMRSHRDPTHMNVTAAHRHKEPVAVGDASKERAAGQSLIDPRPIRQSHNPTLWTDLHHDPIAV